MEGVVGLVLSKERKRIVRERSNYGLITHTKEKEGRNTCTKKGVDFYHSGTRLVVERVLKDRCAVIGLTGKEWGEKVVAFIAPKPEQIIIPEDMKSLVLSYLSCIYRVKSWV